MVWILITQNFWIARACKGGHLLRKKKRENIFKQRWNNKQINNKANIPFITHKHPKSYVTSFYILHFASPSELQGGCTNPLSIENDGLLENAWICYVLKKTSRKCKNFFLKGWYSAPWGNTFSRQAKFSNFFFGIKKSEKTTYLKKTTRTFLAIFSLVNATKFRKQKACLDNGWDYVQKFISKKRL
jgi:hypothetical protein